MNNIVENKKINISGSTLKLIAIITMLIDHIGASVVFHIIRINNEESGGLIAFYYLLRFIGRLAFPIFAFFIVEGFLHTRNKWKYLMRMVLFAFISEIPFDMALVLGKDKILNGTLIEFTMQNVYFTLAIGLLVIIFLDMIEKKIAELPYRYILYGIVILAGMLFAWILHTDYEYCGVLAIVLMYMLRRNREVAFVTSWIALMISSSAEITAIFAGPLIKRYNGKRGWAVKWLFYMFYPVHLLVLAFVLINLG